MTFSLQRLQKDVLARLGESVRAADSSLPVAIPGVAEVLEKKVETLLPSVGCGLIASAPLSALGVGEELSGESTAVEMPCGLYAHDIAIPEDFIRIVSVRMESWHRSAVSVSMPEEPGWMRQWSPEPAIAGCKVSPRVYLLQEGGLRLRCCGSDSEDDALAWLGMWRIPRADGVGRFCFPQGLYEELVSDMALRLLE